MSTRGAVIAAAIAIFAGCGDNIHVGGAIQVSPANELRTSEAGGTATFAITLEHPPASTVTLDLESSNVLEGTVSPARVMITPENYNTGVTVTLTGVDDDAADGSQPYTIHVSATDLTAVDVGVTNDDDDMVGVRVTPTSGLVTTKQGGTATFTVALASLPAGTVTVPLSSSKPAQGIVDQASLTFTPDNWNVERTVKITGKDDGQFSGNVAYTIVTGATTSTDAAYAGLDPADVAVTNLGAKLLSLDLTPVNPTVALGTAAQFTATGIFDDTTTLDLTRAVLWSSSNLNVSTVSNALPTNGRANTYQVGQAMVAAAFGTVSSQTMLTVSPASLTAIQVTPTDPTIAKGTAQQFTATGIYSDNSTQDLTAQVLWSSSQLAVATISNASGSQGRASSVGTGMTFIVARSGQITGMTSLTVTAATLASIQVTPANASVAKGSTVQYTATGIYTDATTQDLTAQVTWGSTTSTTATIAGTGIASAVDVGQTSITASLGGVTGSTMLTVTPATLVSIDVTPTNPAMAKGTTLPFTAVGTFTDASTQDLTTQATWSSTNTTTATISNAAGSKGVASAANAGTTTIRAIFGGVTGSTLLTVTPATLVSIQVTPITPSIAKGTSLQFIATGTYTDATTQDVTSQATWSSTNTFTATISNAAGSQGLATSVDPGTTTIAATFGGQSSSTTLTVTAATLVSIEVTPTNPSAAKGTTVPFTATGVYTDNSTQDLTTIATWASSTNTVATISNAAGTQGRANALDVGTTTISASSGGKTGTTTLTVTAASLVSIQVTPADDSIAKGTTLQYLATGIYTDGSVQNLTSQATWSSTLGSVATISNAAGSQGLATGVATGTTMIGATFGGKSASTSLTVTAATLVSIDVTPANQSIANGTSLQYTATGTYTDNSTQNLTTLAAWSSTVTAVATVSNAAGSQGLASATGMGTTTITATFGGQSGSTTLTVTGVVLTSVVVTPVNPTLAKGTSTQFTCTGVYSDNTTQDLTSSALWATSNAAIATVSNAAGSAGVATAVDVGSADISCSSGGFTDSSTVTVTGATIVSITVSPANATIAKGLQLQYTATVLYSDGVVLDITESATWTSSNTTVATISNLTGFEGLATAANVGSTTITANFGGASGSTMLTVTNPTLNSIAITPVNPTIARNTQLQFVALGTFSDGSTQDITTVATWQSSNTTIATISNAGGTQGIATGQAAGMTTISAIFAGVTGSTTLTVTNAVLVSIAILPSNPTMAPNTQLQLTAIGTFSDGSTQNLTLQVSWKSQNKQVVKVSQARRSRGRATAISAGTSIITATTLGISGTTTITVQ